MLGSALCRGSFLGSRNYQSVSLMFIYSVLGEWIQSWYRKEAEKKGELIISLDLNIS